MARNWFGGNDAEVVAAEPCVDRSVSVEDHVLQALRDVLAHELTLVREWHGFSASEWAQGHLLRSLEVAFGNKRVAHYLALGLKPGKTWSLVALDIYSVRNLLLDAVEKLCIALEPFGGEGRDPYADDAA